MMLAFVLHPSVALRSQIYLPGRSWQRTPPLGRVAFLGPSRQFHLSGGSFRDFFLGVVRRHKCFTPPCSFSASVTTRTGPHSVSSRVYDYVFRCTYGAVENAKYAVVSRFRYAEICRVQRKIRPFMLWRSARPSVPRFCVQWKRGCCVPSRSARPWFDRQPRSFRTGRQHKPSSRREFVRLRTPQSCIAAAAWISLRLWRH